jgi:hypothetical protein
MKRLIIPALFLLSLLAGCAHTPPPSKDLSKFEAARPASILVLPVVNETVEVTAADYFLSTVSVPLAELGYYVFPVNMVKRVLEDEGLSDASLVHSAAATKICNLFGADSVLYVNIKEWNAQYMVLTTTVNVGMKYTIKNCKTDELLWQHAQRISYSPQNTNTGHPVGNLIAMAVSAAVTKAAPNYMPMARQVNAITFYGNGIGIPKGPYALADQKNGANSPAK